MREAERLFRKSAHAWEPLDKREGTGMTLAHRVKELGQVGQSARKGRPEKRKWQGQVEPWLHGKDADFTFRAHRKPL